VTKTWQSMGGGEVAKVLIFRPKFSI
jgi:hypothetical protein